MARDGMYCACTTVYPGGRVIQCSHHTEYDRLAALTTIPPPRPSNYRTGGAYFSAYRAWMKRATGVTG